MSFLHGLQFSPKARLVGHIGLTYRSLATRMHKPMHSSVSPKPGFKKIVASGEAAGVKINNAAERERRRVFNPIICVLK